MATLSNQMFKITKRLDKNYRRASYRAINKAVDKVNTAFAKLMKSETKLPTDMIKRRLRKRKANDKSLFGFVSFGTKYSVPLSEFKPKAKTVKIGKGKKARKYQGVRVTLPTGKEVVKGAWLWTAKSGKSLVLARKTSARYPLTAPKHSLLPYAKSFKPELTNMMKKEYKRIFVEQMKYESTK